MLYPHIELFTCVALGHKLALGEVWDLAEAILKLGGLGRGGPHLALMMGL